MTTERRTPAKRGRKRTPARPTALVAPIRAGKTSRVHDAELRARFLALIRAGMFKSAAADAVGVPRRTIDDWLGRGRASLIAQYDAEEALEAGTDVVMPEPDEPYHSLFLGYLAADTESEARAVQIMHRMIDEESSDRVLTWYMERRWPERWAAPGARITVGGDPSSPVQVNVGGRVDLWSTEDRLAQVIAVLAEAGDQLARQFVAAGAIIDTTADEDELTPDG